MISKVVRSNTRINHSIIKQSIPFIFLFTRDCYVPYIIFNFFISQNTFFRAFVQNSSFIFLRWMLCRKKDKCAVLALVFLIQNLMICTIFRIMQNVPCMASNHSVRCYSLCTLLAVVISFLQQFYLLLDQIFDRLMHQLFPRTGIFYL